MTEVTNDETMTTDAEARPETAGGEAVATEPTSTATLEDEGDIAADYIEELLDIADLDGDLEIEVRAGRAYVAVTASDSAASCCLQAGHCVGAAGTDPDRRADQDR